MHVKHKYEYTIPQIRPTNVLLTAVSIQTVIIYVPNILNNTKCSAPKNLNNTINVEKKLK